MTTPATVPSAATAPSSAPSVLRPAPRFRRATAELSPVEGLPDEEARRIDEAVAAAQRAFEPPVGAAERIDRLDRLERMLLQHRQPLKAALEKDLGKSATEAELTEIGVSLTELRHVRRHLQRWMRPRPVPSAQMLAPSTARIEPQPLGTVLIIAPWNYPVQLLLSPLVGALAAGDTAVVKPSEVTPHVAQALAEALQEHLGDCVRPVLGGVAQTTRLLQHRFDHIFYTGNSTVGRVIMRAAAEHLTPVTLELGGKSPVWIDRSADLPAAARRLAWAKLVNAGQTCVAPDYLMGPADVLAELESLLPEAIRGFYGPDPQASPSYGRIVTPRHLERLTEMLQRIPAADIVAGGQHDASDRYLAPTLVRSAPDGPAMEEEIFGPVLPMIAVEDHLEAVRFIQQGEKPLSLYVFSQDQEVRHDFGELTSSGGLGFEIPMAHVVHPQLPFGGVGASGTGSYHGLASFEAFSHLRPVLDKPLSPETLKVTFPPYTGLKAGAARTLLSIPAPGDLVRGLRRRLRG